MYTIQGRLVEQVLYDVDLLLRRLSEHARSPMPRIIHKQKIIEEMHESIHVFVVL